MPSESEPREFLSLHSKCFKRLWIGFLQTNFFNIVTKFCLFPIGLGFVARGNQVGGMLLLLLVLVLVP